MKKVGVIGGGIFLFTLIVFYKNYFSSTAPTPTPMTTAEERVIEKPRSKVPEVSKKPLNFSKSESPSQTGFKELLQTGEKILPTQAELSQLTNEEAHGHPERLREGAMVLGDIAQAIKDDPKLIPQALNFYEKCAKRSELSRPIRALCFSDLSQLDPHNPRLAEMVPLEISNLAKRLL